MSGQEERIPEEDDTTAAPLTMAASVVLTNLPRDASKALETAGDLTVQKSMHMRLVIHYQQKKKTLIH
jgi:ubiquitin-like protein ATG12